MKEHPIIFSTDMVKAILEGRKTMTRRVVKQLGSRQWEFVGENPDGYIWADNIGSTVPIKCPYGQVGDRLWARHRYDLFDIYYKPLEGYEGLYSAGTDGHIYRMDKDKPHIIQETPTGGKGYLSISLSKGNIKSTQNVHRLMAQAFYGLPPTNKTQTRHLDGDNQNNHPSNLDWGTQEDNWLDRNYHGRGKGEQHHNHKLTRSQVADIRVSHLSQRELAHKYQVSQPTIQAIISGTTWQDATNQPLRNYPEWNGWRSPLFCPRWASRITLEITELRVERLQEITEGDAMAEGIKVIDETHDKMYSPPNYPDIHRDIFIDLWDSLNAKRGYGWDTNCWVWVIGFKKDGNANQAQ